MVLSGERMKNILVFHTCIFTTCINTPIDFNAECYKRVFGNSSF